MRRLIWGSTIGLLIGCLILTMIDNPYVIIGYFGSYLIATVLIFQYSYEKLHKIEIGKENIYKTHN